MQLNVVKNLKYFEPSLLIRPAHLLTIIYHLVNGLKNEHDDKSSFDINLHFGGYYLCSGIQWTSALYI